MISLPVQLGDRVIVPVRLTDSSNRPNGKTAIAFGSVTVNYAKYGVSAAASVARAAYTVVSADWAELDATNMPGIYAFQLPAAAVNTLGSVVIRFSGTGFDDYNLWIKVVPWTPGNIRVISMKADQEVSGRKIAAGAISHLRVAVKGEIATDWTTVLNTFYTTFSYFNIGDVQFGGYAEVKTTEPTDATSFTAAATP